MDLGQSSSPFRMNCPDEEIVICTYLKFEWHVTILTDQLMNSEATLTDPIFVVRDFSATETACLIHAYIQGSIIDIIILVQQLTSDGDTKS